VDNREWKPSAHPSRSLDSRTAGFSEAKAEFKRTNPDSRAQHVQPKRYVGHLRNRPKLLGELAVDAGLIDRDALYTLLGSQKHGQARIGEMMLRAGHMRASDLAMLLSTQSGIPFIDLYTQPIDPTLCNAVDLDFYINNDCIAWRWKNREPVYVAADPLSVRAAVEELEGRPCRIFFASPRAIRQVIQKRFLIELGERARLELARATPENSAQHRLSISQTWIIPTIVFLLACAAWVAPHAFVAVANVLFAAGFITIAALKLLSIGIGLERNAARENSIPEVNSHSEDNELPIYSILVPLFREASVLPILINALSKLDYPASKLQFLLIFEETDKETIETAKSLNLPDNFEFIVVPFSFPLTKPKACNFALSFARGEFLVIFDAEDLPEPDQLRRAVNAFRAGDEKLACVQARLNYYNQFENWLTRQFTLEYAAYFDLLLPTFERLGFPIPLGGTSTHFRTSSLRKAGAWDPFNVTEDADLGMRLAMLGFKTGLIDSTTYEEANCRVDNWLRQRSRWTKGWIQTYLVRMRHPVKLYKALGLRGFVGFQIVIGGFSLSNLVHPLFFLSALASIGLTFVAAPEAQADVPQSSNIAIANLIVLSTGYSISILAGMTAVTQRGLRPLILSALAMPAYWLLISFGSYKALAQLISRPFHWEKTDHGLSRLWAQRRAVALREIAAENLKNHGFSVTKR
tara:strand:- start:3805 stop:5880 length:2076 start_codon:yes stop_codon:yes gene_type:complete